MIGIKTIFTNNKRKRGRAFVVVFGDGRGYGYRYANWSQRKDRDQFEGWGDLYRRPLYRINVIPRQKGAL